MKRFVIIAALAAMVLGVVSMASATEVKFKGQYDFAFKWMDNVDFFDADDDNRSEDDFGARQRFRMQMDFIASEQLKGVFFIESGETYWGRPNSGDLGTDGVTIEVRRAYIEFLVPNTALTLKVGMQGVGLPATELGSPIFDDDVAGIVASYAINDNFNLAAMWLRPLDLAGDIVGNDPAHDEVDVFGTYLAMNFDGWSLTPYVVMALAGKDTNIGNYYSLAGSILGPDDDTFAWWLGASFELTMFDPFYFGLDLAYGNASADHDYEDRYGFYIQGLMSYDLGYMTPGLAGWYSTGDDNNLGDGSETFPSITGYFYGSTFAFDGYSILSGGDIVAANTRGTWGIGFFLKDISFVEDLTHALRINYVRGTHSDNAWPWIVGGTAGLTNDDHAWEVTFDHQYKIYDQLSLLVEMGYANLDLEGVNNEEDAWKMALGLKYKF